MVDIPANNTTKAVLEGIHGLGGFEIAGSYSGQLEKPGDHDWVRVTLSAGVTYHFYLSFVDTGSATSGDSELFLFNSLGVQLDTDDSGGVGANSFLEFTPATSGTYFIDVGEVDNNNTGDYSLFVTSVIETDVQLTSGIDIHTGVGDDTNIVGGRGADTITIGAGLHALGEQGNDTIIGNASFNIISGGLGDDTLVSGGGADYLFGDAGNDVLFGGSGGCDMFGGPGNDILDGEAGGDSLIGGSGKDFLTGGTGGDTFRFTTVTESRKGAARDVIQDFSSVDGDDISLNQIDAKKGVAGIQDFKFIGKQGFHDKAGELHFVKKGAFLLVEGDVNGDGRADFQIEVHGVATLTVGDFNL